MLIDHKSTRAVSLVNIGKWMECKKKKAKFKKWKAGIHMRTDR